MTGGKKSHSFGVTQDKKGKEKNHNILSFRHDNFFEVLTRVYCRLVFCKVAAVRLSEPLTENRKECFKP